MSLEAIGWILFVQAFHESVSMDFGNDRGSRNRRHTAITLNDSVNFLGTTSFQSVHVLHIFLIFLIRFHLSQLGFLGFLGRFFHEKLGQLPLVLGCFDVSLGHARPLLPFRQQLGGPIAAIHQDM